MRASSAAVCVLLVAAGASGCGSSSSGGDEMSAQSSTVAPKAAAPAGGPAVESATVDIKSFKYAPVTATVKRGGRVRWTNSDSTAHTATADDRSFDTQTIDKGAAGMVTFTTPGRFAYHCEFHPFMKATVVVR
jgi:plastocyanin